MLTRGFDRERELERSPVANHNCGTETKLERTTETLLSRTHPRISTRAVAPSELAFLVDAVNIFRLVYNVFAQ